MHILKAAKARGPSKEAGIYRHDLDAFAEGLGVHGRPPPADIVNAALSLTDYISERLAPSIAARTDLPAVEIVRAANNAIRLSKRKLAPYSGAEQGSKPSLLDIIGGTISNFKTRNDELDAATAARAAAESMNVSLQADLESARTNVAELHTAFQNTWNEAEVERETYKAQIKTLNGGLHDLGERLGVPEDRRTPEGIHAKVSNLIATANREKYQALDSAVRHQDEARNVKANARENVDLLQEANKELQASHDKLQGFYSNLFRGFIDLKKKFADLQDHCTDLQILHDEIEKKFTNCEQDQRTVSSFVADFRTIWQDIIIACEKVYLQESSSITERNEVRNTKRFRDAVGHVWEHLCREIWSDTSLLPSLSQITFSATDSRQTPSTITRKFSPVESREKNHDLDHDLSYIISSALRLRAELHSTRPECFAHIPRITTNLDHHPVNAPLVIVLSTSGACACLGLENLGHGA